MTEVRKFHVFLSAFFAFTSAQSTRTAIQLIDGGKIVGQYKLNERIDFLGYKKTYLRDDDIVSMLPGRDKGDSNIPRLGTNDQEEDEAVTLIQSVRLKSNER